MVEMIVFTLFGLFVVLPLFVALSGILIRFTIRLVLAIASLVILFFIAKFLFIFGGAFFLLTDHFKLTNVFN